MALEISKQLKTPGIAVIEAPTGEGKTEAAMFLADAWNTSLNQNRLLFRSADTGDEQSDVRTGKIFSRKLFSRPRHKPSINARTRFPFGGI